MFLNGKRLQLAECRCDGRPWDSNLRPREMPPIEEWHDNNSVASHPVSRSAPEFHCIWTNVQYCGNIVICDGYSVWTTLIIHIPKKDNLVLWMAESMLENSFFFLTKKGKNSIHCVDSLSIHHLEYCDVHYKMQCQWF